jgi:hypothetical protein
VQVQTITPSQISELVATQPMMTPAYNWDKQTRYEGLLAMASTMNTKQTFNSNGQPCDHTSDQD